MLEKDWSRERCFQLLDEYEKHPELWNLQDGCYYNKFKKNKSWCSIAQVIGCSPVETRKKVDSMLASFRREKAKGKKFVGTGNTREVYSSRWFAFKRMAFLLGRCKSKNVNNSMEIDTPNIEPEVTFNEHVTPDDNQNLQNLLQNEEINDDDDDNNDEEPSIMIVSPPSNLVQKQVKLKKTESGGDTKSGEGHISKDNEQSSCVQTNECSFYAQYVTCKLQQYSKRTRAMVEHQINNILFRADMGHFDPSILSSTESHHPPILPHPSDPASSPEILEDSKNFQYILMNSQGMSQK